MVSKRLVDLSLAVPLVVLSAPALVALAGLIRLDSPGPVFYLSDRVGQGGRLFRPYRFRTMRVGTVAHLSPDEKLTRVGRWMRTISLDHLPTLLNVLRGEMSLVGPRPMEPEQVDMDNPAWQRILSVRPGLVSWAIHRLGREYNASSLEEKMELELEYVARQSIRFDLWLLGRTARALIASRGNIKARGTPFPGRNDLR